MQKNPQCAMCTIKILNVQLVQWKISTSNVRNQNSQCTVSAIKIFSKQYAQLKIFSVQPKFLAHIVRNQKFSTCNICNKNSQCVRCITKYYQHATHVTKILSAQCRQQRFSACNVCKKEKKISSPNAQSQNYLRASLCMTESV